MSNIVSVVQKIAPSGSGNLLKDCALESLGKKSVQDNNKGGKNNFSVFKTLYVVYFLVNI